MLHVANMVVRRNKLKKKRIDYLHSAPNPITFAAGF